MKKIFLLFLFFTHTVFAANNDSLKVKNKVFPLKYYMLSQFEYTDSASYLENTLLDFQNYLPRSISGNIGLAYNDLIYKTNTPFGFNYSKNNFQHYFYTPFSLRFYDTRIPYTDLFYVFGSKKEQFFKMTLSYNIKKNWNVTANFSRIKSLGFYSRQKTDHTCFALSTNYKTLNNRYMLLASAAINRLKNEENGGLKKDTTVLGDVYDIVLNDARNFISNTNIFLKQYLNLGYRINDTSPVIPGSRFILTSYIEDMSSKFVNLIPTDGYFDHHYYGPVTNDTSNILKLENELAWKRVDNLKRRFTDALGVGVSVKNQFIHVQQPKMDTAVNDFVTNIDTTFNNFISGAELSNLFSSNKFWWKLNATYGIKGYNKDDYTYSAVFTKGFRDSLTRVSIYLKSSERAPDFMYNKYATNYFRWTNQFEKIKEEAIGANFVSDKYNLALNVDYTSYSNVLYFDTAALAQQYKGAVQVIAVALKKNITFHNWHLNNKINYQYVPDSSVIRVPQFILQHALYYENNIFKKAMRIQIGFSVFYNTAYYANAFMPANSQFYMQNKEEYGNYPIIDFFLNAKIKVVNVFFKIDHLNYGMSGKDYMLTPNYFLNQRAFKFGVSWKFWN